MITVIVSNVTVIVGAFCITQAVYFSSSPFLPFPLISLLLPPYLISFFYSLFFSFSFAPSFDMYFYVYVCAWLLVVIFCVCMYVCMLSVVSSFQPPASCTIWCNFSVKMTPIMYKNHACKEGRGESLVTTELFGIRALILFITVMTTFSCT